MRSNKKWLGLLSVALFSLSSCVQPYTESDIFTVTNKSGEVRNIKATKISLGKPKKAKIIQKVSYLEQTNRKLNLKFKTLREFSLPQGYYCYFSLTAKNIFISCDKYASTPKVSTSNVIFSGGGENFLQEVYKNTKFKIIALNSKYDANTLIAQQGQVIDSVFVKNYLLILSSFIKDKLYLINLEKKSLKQLAEFISVGGDGEFVKYNPRNKYIAVNIASKPFQLSLVYTTEPEEFFNTGKFEYAINYRLTTIDYKAKTKSDFFVINNILWYSPRYNTIVALKPTKKYNSLNIEKIYLLPINGFFFKKGKFIEFFGIKREKLNDNYKTIGLYYIKFDSNMNPIKFTKLISYIEKRLFRSKISLIKIPEVPRNLQITYISNNTYLIHISSTPLNFNGYLIKYNANKNKIDWILKTTWSFKLGDILFVGDIDDDKKLEIITNKGILDFQTGRILKRFNTPIVAVADLNKNKHLEFLFKKSNKIIVKELISKYGHILAVRTKKVSWLQGGYNPWNENNLDLNKIFIKEAFISQ